eukprot:g36490.t1
MGSTMAQWVAPQPHSARDLGLIPALGTVYVVFAHSPRVCVGFFWVLRLALSAAGTFLSRCCMVLHSHLLRDNLLQEDILALTKVEYTLKQAPPSSDKKPVQFFLFLLSLQLQLLLDYMTVLELRMDSLWSIRDAEEVVDST